MHFPYSKGSRRGRRLKLFRKTTFLVNDSGGGQAFGSDHDDETNRNKLAVENSNQGYI